LPAVIASAVTIGLIALPFVVMGNIAGLEILHPAAVVILGGVFSTTLLVLFVVPAIYARFTARPVPEKRALEAEIA
jgi:Cu/Ag efflux pump CusA